MLVENPDEGQRSRTMKAVVLAENAVLMVEDRPQPTPDERRSVLVRVAAAGVCGSDLPRAFEQGAYSYPLVLGHELSGVVEEAPYGSEFSEGDRVVVFPLIPCRACPPCSVGEYAQCTDYDYLGSRSDGGFSEFVVAPEENLFRVPQHLDLTHAALTEPTAVAFHGIRQARLDPGSGVVVFGGGPIGLLAAQWARVSGAGRIYVVDVSEPKLALATELGFEAIDGRKDDPVAAIRDGAGRIDLAVEACGIPLTYRQSLTVVDTFGSVVLMGNLKGDLSLSEQLVSSILRRELTIHGTWNSRITPLGRDEWTTSLAAMGRTIQIEPILSHRVSLDDAPAMLESMYRRTVDYVRVAVVPGEA